mgnify:CR=1 FL=1
MTIPNITATVIKGFGTGVGGFSNTATILYSMAAIFNKPGHEDQYNTIMTRIKLLREIVGQEIDRIKGADKPSLPRAWKKFEQINEDDSPEEKTRKIKANAIVISKKPYFFRYLYPELNQKFKQFESSYNQISKDEEKTMKDFWAEELQNQQKGKKRKVAVLVIILLIIILILINGLIRALYLNEIEEMGLENILALKGDEPKDNLVCYRDFQYANELVIDEFNAGHNLRCVLIL